MNNSTGLEYFELIKQEVLSASQKRGKRKNQNPSRENKCENPEDSSDVKRKSKDSFRFSFSFLTGSSFRVMSGFESHLFARN